MLDGQSCVRCAQIGLECFPQDRADKPITTEAANPAHSASLGKRRMSVVSTQQAEVPQASPSYCASASFSATPASYPHNIPQLPLYPSWDTPPSFQKINTSLGSYWRTFHSAYPLIHRQTFDSAMSTGNTLYGAHKPQALLFAMAAAGALTADSHPVPEARKHDVVAEYIQRSKDLLLAGVAASALTDLETVQTMVILITVMISLGQESQLGSLLKPAVEVLVRLLALDPTRRTMRIGNREPRHVNEWLQNEMSLRCFISLASIDLSLTYFARYPCTHIDYFGVHRFPLPCSEIFFDSGTPVECFQVLYGASRIVGAAFVELGHLSDLHSAASDDPIIRQFVEPVFDGRASIMSFMHLANLFRALRLSLREFANIQNVDAFVAFSPSQKILPSAVAINTFCTRVKAFDTLVARIFQGMPPVISGSLQKGEAQHFLSDRWRTWFTNSSHPTVVLWSLVACLGTTLEHCISGDPSSPAAREIIGAPQFRKMLQITIIIVRFCNGILDHDCSPWASMMGLAAVLRAGTLSIAVVRVLSVHVGTGSVDEATIEGCSRDAIVIGRLLDKLGRLLGPPGTWCRSLLGAANGMQVGYCFCPSFFQYNRLL